MGEWEQMLCKFVVRFYDLLREEGRFLLPAAKAELPELGRSLAELYSAFAAEAAPGE